MEKFCRISLTTQNAPLDPKLDNMFKTAALMKKVALLLLPPFSQKTTYWYQTREWYFLLKSTKRKRWENHFQEIWADPQVDEKSLQTVLYIDCTKLGVVSQPEVNMIGEIAEAVLSRNPTRNWSYMFLASFGKTTFWQAIFLNIWWWRWW